MTGRPPMRGSRGHRAVEAAADPTGPDRATRDPAVAPDRRVGPWRQGRVAQAPRSTRGDGDRDLAPRLDAKLPVHLPRVVVDPIALMSRARPDLPVWTHHRRPSGRSAA